MCRCSATSASSIVPASLGRGWCLLFAEGSHTEIKASLTTTRLYHKLTKEVSSMAFYDVKNAKLCNIYEGEGVIMFTVCPPPT